MTLPARKARTTRRVSKEVGPPANPPAGAAQAHQARWRMLQGHAAPGRPTGTPPADHAEQVGRRLQVAFGQILRHLPVAKVAEVARWLELDRSVCQRVVMGVRDATDGLGVLERFPGVRGLEQFIAAAESRGCGGDLGAEAHQALEAYARLVSDAGGSQARLVEHIEGLRARGGARDATASEADLERWRRRNYESAVAITGLASESRVDIVILGPSTEGERGRYTTVSATGMIGVEATPWAMPLTRRSRLAGLTPVPEPSGEGEARPSSGLTPDLLLAPFTSEPPPRVTTRTEGEFLLQVFNPDNGHSGPFDVVAGMAFSWPWEDPHDPSANYFSIGRVIGPPARRLVLDFYLHRSLPAPTSVTAHVLRPGTMGSLGDARPRSRWFDRLPIELDLILLGGAPGARPSPAYPRLGELTRHLLDSMDWVAEPFSGYRLEVTWPLFDMEYVIAAEF